MSLQSVCTLIAALPLALFACWPAVACADEDADLTRHHVRTWGIDLSASATALWTDEGNGSAVRGMTVSGRAWRSLGDEGSRNTRPGHSPADHFAVGLSIRGGGVTDTLRGAATDGLTRASGYRLLDIGGLLRIRLSPSLTQWAPIVVLGSGYSWQTDVAGRDADALRQLGPYVATDVAVDVVQLGGVAMGFEMGAQIRGLGEQNDVAWTTSVFTSIRLASRSD